MKKIWLRSLLLFILLFPLSVFLHETAHWLVYELNDIDSWISLQRANLANPEQILPEDVFLKSLIAGPLLTILIGLFSYFFLRKKPTILWLFILGLINITFRILPTLIGIITSFGTGLKGVSDEGNIMLRISDNVFLREFILISFEIFFLYLIVKLYKCFQPKIHLKQKKVLAWMICLLTVVVSLMYPALDKMLFGI